LALPLLIEEWNVMIRSVSSNLFITVSTATEGASDWSDVAELSNGRTVHVWHDGGDKDGSAAGIFARILDANFQRVGDEFQVNTQTFDYQRLCCTNPERDSSRDV
jgi:hypothetical protein